MSALIIMLCLLSLSLTQTTVPNSDYGKIRWLKSEDGESAVKISFVIAVLSSTLQQNIKNFKDYAKWINGNYFCCAIYSIS